MIAAVVLLALVASTQAFPGNNELQVNKGSVDTKCIFDYYQKFAALFRGTNTGSEIIDVVDSCNSYPRGMEWLVCLSNATRAHQWNLNTFLNDVLGVYPTAIQYTLGFVHECFSH